MIPCRTCEQGELIKRDVYRLSPPVVVIGYIFLMPFVLTVATCLAAVVLGYLEGLLGYSEDRLSRSMLIGAGAIGGFAIFVSFVASLLGWLLIMKKRILKCTFCGAVTNAS